MTDPARRWDAVRAHLERARAVDARLGPAEEALVAIALHHAATGFEQLLRARAEAQGHDADAPWAELLDAATQAWPADGMALLPDGARSAWARVLTWRDLWREAVAEEADPDALDATRTRLSWAVEATKPGMRAWLAAARSVGEA